MPGSSGRVSGLRGYGLLNIHVNPIPIKPCRNRRSPAFLVGLAAIPRQVLIVAALLLRSRIPAFPSYTYPPTPQNSFNNITSRGLLHGELPPETLASGAARVGFIGFRAQSYPKLLQPLSPECSNPKTPKLGFKSSPLIPPFTLNPKTYIDPRP